MKIVEEESKLENLFATAKNEAKNILVMMSCILKNISKNPRHIEVQIMSGKNKTVHLGERDWFGSKKTSKIN